MHTHRHTHTMRQTTQRDPGDRGEIESGVKGKQGGCKGQCTENMAAPFQSLSAGMGADGLFRKGMRQIK